MFEKLIEVEQKYETLQTKLADPEVFSNPKEYQKINKEVSEIKELVATFRHYKKTKQELEDNRQLLQEKDEEMRQMAKEEITRLEPELDQLSAQLKILLLPTDPNDEKNIFLEIRAGAGGDEAALFAADLLRMYSKFAESKKWQVEILDSSNIGLGGLKDAVVQISGEKVYSLLKYESGVHRVQRVPQTEAQGRIHTSTVTVAVLPEVADVEIDVKESDLQVDVFRASGPGGQSVNTTDSAVRITHLPTGLAVVCRTEKSQHKNKSRALSMLKSRLLEAEQEKLAKETAQARKSQVGTGDRSEKIRTYNFPQNRLTDHRVGLTLYQLDTVMNGKLDLVIDPVRAHFQALALQSSSEK